MAENRIYSIDYQPGRLPGYSDAIFFLFISSENESRHVIITSYFCMPLFPFEKISSHNLIHWRYYYSVLNNEITKCSVNSKMNFRAIKEKIHNWHAVILFFGYILYLVIGAFVFQHLEEENEVSKPFKLGIELY